MYTEVKPTRKARMTAHGQIERDSVIDVDHYITVRATGSFQ